ncbi:phosphotransferase [Solwaraspora sp. WMMD406]|uniref:phosphotransferase family protein n=1 Tax=Solwaraspora sp. WMMD406 TaxID=3016095 RepID=UPI002416C838|nr:phosphotransferase [Solwaraspora sp. WMMD406]MDG4765147.1 phosphotransferase [Solwaraspora sp. WMMD406]
MLGSGQDHTVRLVGDDLVVRCAKRPGDATSVRQQAALLDVVSRTIAADPRIRLAVPVPLSVDPANGCLTYRKLAGTPLLEVSARRRRRCAGRVGTAVGQLLAVLHSIPAARLADLVEVDHLPLTDWRDEAAASYPSVAGRIPARHRPAIEAFLAAAVPDDVQPPDSSADDLAFSHSLVFSHNDLGIEHILVTDDPGRPLTVTGVIDWSDAAVVDPAYDFGLLYRDLGPVALRAALTAYPAPLRRLAELARRARFHARCAVLEDLAYGLLGADQWHRRYVDKSLLAMRWLYPPGTLPTGTLAPGAHKRGTARR